MLGFEEKQIPHGTRLAAEKVDAARPKVAGSLYRLGHSAPDAEAHAVLFHTFVFGQSMLFLAAKPSRRADLAAAFLQIEQE